MRTGSLQAVVVQNVLAASCLKEVFDRLERHDPPFLQTWFPPAFRARFYGRNLNLTEDWPGRYFDEAAVFNDQLRTLVPGATGLQERVIALLAGLDRGRRFMAAPGPSLGQRYMFTTLRAHDEQGYIPAHYDNEMRLRPAYRHLALRVESHILSFVLALSLAEQGGALEVFDRCCEPDDARFMNDDGVRDKPVLETLASVSFRLPPGSLIVLDSGRYLHRLTPVVGAHTRWSACSFMARSLDGDATWCWG